MPIILIDNYDSFTFNLFQMVQAVSPVPVLVFRNDEKTLEELLALHPEKIILSPGPGHPDLASDFGVCRDLIASQDTHGIPILGVCLGHQGLSSVYGAKVVQAPAIVHGKTSEIDVLAEDCPLFTGLSRPFQAMRYHSLVVEEASLPSVLKVTCKDKTHGLIMGVQHESLPLYGVQFHPESIGTPEGQALLKNFVDRV
ncbi:MAG: aminodeoxychorismate/anthranilate synthase component II [Vampirovibrionales bacterium]|jgi:anthranilate synthase/aminodeoxychorismate synthase-like glutamine amidotransferase|nr:aminodeoxychorismate/anthranilate synthase component II [Vampirovibrionales bacterium]